MVRLAELSDGMRKAVTEAPCPRFEPHAWTAPPSARSRVVSLISSAGVHRRGEDPFVGKRAADYGAIADVTPVADVVKHLETNTE